MVLYNNNPGLSVCVHVLWPAISLQACDCITAAASIKCRVRHWQVLEWLLFLNTHDAVVYHREWMLGDKDTFRAAFALAGVVEEFRQVPHMPAIPTVDRRMLNVTEVSAGVAAVLPATNPALHQLLTPPTPFPLHFRSRAGCFSAWCSFTQTAALCSTTALPGPSFLPVSRLANWPAP